MKISISELLDLTDGELLHPGNAADITGMASLDEAGPEDVSFLGNEKYHQDYLKTSAAVVLLPEGVPEQPAPDKSVALVRVKNPSIAFADLAKHFFAAREFMPGVDPSACIAMEVHFDPDKVCIKAGAVIESGASIGEGTEIGPGAVLGSGVHIGKNCLLHANVTVREGCMIGDRVILQPGCVIGSDGYGYELIDGRHEKVDQFGIVVLEDDVEIGANTTIDRARFGKTTIGEGSKIDNLVQIAHNVKIGKHCLVVAQSGLAGSSSLGDYVTLAAQTGVSGHIMIHDRAVLSARAAALKDLDGDTVYMGMPARPLREEQKKLASVARLPKLVKELRDLRHRIEELESG